MSASRQSRLGAFERDIPNHRTFHLVTLFANVANNQPHGKEKQLVSSYLEPAPVHIGRQLKSRDLLNSCAKDEGNEKIITNIAIRREKKKSFNF